MDSRKQDSQVYTYTDENISPLPASLDIVLILSNAGNSCRDGEYCGGPENGEGSMWLRVLECYLRREEVGAEDLLGGWEESRMAKMLLLFESRGNKSREK